MLRQQLLDTSRGRIVSLLQRGPLTVDDIASKLELSASGVRAQITAMERDGVVRRVGTRPGATRPSRIFELTPEVEQLLSRAYIPLLTQLVDVFANGLPASGRCALAGGGKKTRRFTVLRSPFRHSAVPCRCGERNAQ
jgi:predicted ArsR family transcriptional regulator